MRRSYIVWNIYFRYAVLRGLKRICCFHFQYKAFVKKITAFCLPLIDITALLQNLDDVILFWKKLDNTVYFYYNFMMIWKKIFI